MNTNMQISLSFHGNEADDNIIDLYDVSRALIGFQRSIALTTHLALNNEIITQSPSLKGAKIYALPAEIGSWKITASILISTVLIANHITTAPKETPLGHLVHSLYDYVISESLGFHVDYSKSLGQLYEENQKKNILLPYIKKSKAESLVEKCNNAIEDMHRPIIKTKTAQSATITTSLPHETIMFQSRLTMETYDYLHETSVSDVPVFINGDVSSYNKNTFKGRIFIKDIGRPISFTLSASAKNRHSISLITESLYANATNDTISNISRISCRAYRHESKNGYLKSITIDSVWK